MPRFASDRNRCRICSGALELRVSATTPGTLAAAALAPSLHEPPHGDLSRCRECASIRQSGLPVGAALVDLYREMSDATYADEEAGRRRTAHRLLDMVAVHRPSGRLLDVGCGHGFLLDEARRRGYDGVGLELSRTAAAHARDTLGLDVREEPLAGFVDRERFDVIILADVIEHVEDPVAMLDACVELLRPDGVLCVVTPDPSAVTARLAGARWWGYVPAHGNLLPRRTLLELISARGLVVSADVGLVRTFSWAYWLLGLARRAGRGGPALRALARRIPPSASLSLSLRDERVVLAHRVHTLPAVDPLVSRVPGAQQVWIVLPAYNAARTIGSVACEMPPGAADHALLVDDASSDDTVAAALELGFDVVSHPANRGYGANQKTCYSRALLAGADVVVMVHADNQYDPALVPRMVAPILTGEADVVIGSRLLDDHAVKGGMPRWKWLGNRLLTGIENRAFGASFSEYHTGYRAFSAQFLRSIPFLRNSDGFVFDQEIFAQMMSTGARVTEVAIPTRYFHEASSVSFPTSVKYGLRTLAVLTRFRIDRRRRSWPLLRRPAARLDVRPAAARLFESQR